MKTMAIKIWLMRKKISQRSIAKRIGVTQPSVSQTINNQIKSKKVIEGLKELGVPARLLREDTSQ